MRLKNKAIILFLCVLLLTCMLPTAAFAAGPIDTPLLEGWAKFGGGYTGDLNTSAINPYDVAVNDKQLVQYPDIYTLMNGLSTYRVMKGTYSAAENKYNYSPVSGSQPFKADSIPLSLAFVGSYYSSDYTLYVATNNMYSGPCKEKIWKFDGTTWTDITYGLAINSPCIALTLMTCLQLEPPA